MEEQIVSNEEANAAMRLLQNYVQQRKLRDGRSESGRYYALANTDLESAENWIMRAQDGLKGQH